MAYSNKFYPSNPKKYIGDPKNIISRSTWEYRVMSWLDKNDDIIAWGSEELIIPYISPIDSRQHRYFPDFIVKAKTKDNKTKTMVIEIKPDKETREPKQKKRITEQYVREVTTWGVNQAKWKAATEYCLDRGWEFKVLTEKHLNF
jgi:hypothetical protein